MNRLSKDINQVIPNRSRRGRASTLTTPFSYRSPGEVYRQFHRKNQVTMATASGSKAYMLQNKDGIHSASFVTWSKETIRYLKDRQPNEVPADPEKARMLYQAKKFIGERTGYGALEDVIGSTPSVPRSSIYTLMPMTSVKDQVNAFAKDFDEFYGLRDGDGAIGRKAGRSVANMIAGEKGFPSTGVLDLEEEDVKKQLEAHVEALRGEIEELQAKVQEQNLRVKVLVDSVALGQLQVEAVQTDVATLVTELDGVQVASTALTKFKTGDHYWSDIRTVSVNTDRKRRRDAIRTDEGYTNPESLMDRYNTPNKRGRGDRAGGLPDLGLNVGNDDEGSPQADV